MPEEKKAGKITHYFSKIGVAVIKVTDETLKKGDTIHIKGTTSDFTQKIDSMEAEHEKIEEAKKGVSVGLKVAEQVRSNDVVYKVTK